MTTAKNSSADPGRPAGVGWMPCLRGRSAPQRPTIAWMLIWQPCSTMRSWRPRPAQAWVRLSRSPRLPCRKVWRLPRVWHDPLVGVDLPPVAAEAQPVPAVEPESVLATPMPPIPAAPPPIPEPQPERHLPTTQRFGAIIMDTSSEPMPVSSEAPSDALVPIRAETKSILPPDSGKEPDAARAARATGTHRGPEADYRPTHGCDV